MMPDSVAAPRPSRPPRKRVTEGNSFSPVLFLSCCFLLPLGWKESVAVERALQTKRILLCMVLALEISASFATSAILRARHFDGRSLMLSLLSGGMALSLVWVWRGLKRPKLTALISAPEPSLPLADLPEMEQAVVKVRSGSSPRSSRRSSESLDGSRQTRALIVGAGAIGVSLAERLEKERGYAVVGFVDDEAQVAASDRWPLLGSRDATVALAQSHNIDEVILAYAPTWQQELAEALVTELDDVAVRVVPSYYETLMQTRQVQNVGDIALVPLSTQVSPVTDATKRMFDVAVSGLFLVALAPVLPLVALLIRASSPGPAIFAQTRIGRMGKPFTLYKFRTMRTDAETLSGPMLSPGSHDFRLTGVGKWLRIFRVDEVPQLWNVLRGEMSLVGPRPERPWFVEQFIERNPVYARRHLVRPGITGLAQIRAGYHTDARDKLRFDLYYISHQSVGFDLALLWQTILLIFRSRDY